MKRFAKSLTTLLCAAALALPLLAMPVFAGCSVEYGNNPNLGPDPDPGPSEIVDYAGMLALDFTSETKKQEVTIRLHIDGDTTHFDPVKNSTVTPNANPSDFDQTDGYIKARYLAINTPESTGKIEKWGKTASKFTESKLKSAESIVIESDDDKWNIDSTGERYTLWIWYKPQGEAAYRNLNIEILQEGFAWGSSTVNNRYGEYASRALRQAQDLKLHIFSPADTVDENYFGSSEAAEITLKELTCHFEDYNDHPVIVEGNVIAVYDNNAYIEDYDEETDTYFGMQVYLHFTYGTLRTIYAPGNRVRVYGTAVIGLYGNQITGVQYNDYDPEYYKNSTIVGEAGSAEASFREIEPKDLATEQNVDFKFENEEAEGGYDTVTIDYRKILLNTSVTMKDLTVTGVYTTASGNSKGAMTITCTGKNADGTTSTFDIRTEVLHDENGNLITAERFPVGSKIKLVKGIVGYYESTYEASYQINVHTIDWFQFE